MPKAKSKKAARKEVTDALGVEQVELRPQPAQVKFLTTPADIAVFGGAAGGGKSWSLLFEALRHVTNPDFGAVIFRRTYPEITATGGLWPESKKAYYYLGGKPRETDLCWTFPRVPGESLPSGATVKFGHLQYEDDVMNWLGSQICYLAFDQLETFTERQFFYLLSRNRSVCGVRPYCRATANPEPGWLEQFLGWWIDQDTGFPIVERAGQLRYFVRAGDQVVWGSSKDELRPYGLPPQSVTFIPATLEDNPILMRSDPAYLAKLMALPHIEQMRLRWGNWKSSAEKGEWPPDYFGSHNWFQIWPTEFICSVMAVDPSKGSKSMESRFGDFCAIVLVRLDKFWNLWVDAWMGKWNTTDILKTVLHLYKEQGPTGIVFETNGFQELLAGDFTRLCVESGVFPRVWGVTNQEPKPTRIRRIGPYLAQRRIRFKENSEGARLLLNQLRTFGPKDPTLHDDGPDALEMAIRMCDYLINGHAGTGVQAVG